MRPNANTEQILSRTGGANITVNLNVAGSLLAERDVVRVIRDEFRRGGFGGVR